MKGIGGGDAYMRPALEPAMNSEVAAARRRIVRDAKGAIMNMGGIWVVMVCFFCGNNVLSNFDGQ